MEVSKKLQDNIKNVQNQLKLAIQNHQVILLKHQSSPLSGNLKVQLWEIQKHIISLGEAQKRLVQQLRKELEANATNCTLNPTAIHAPQEPCSSPPQEPRPSPPEEPPVGNCKRPVPDSELVQFPDTGSGLLREQTCKSQEDVVSPATVEAGTPALPANTNESHSVNTDTHTSKLDFMSALGLVTHACLAELRNRRVERKRRSTANHFQFVYGNSWDVCKRKKGKYLLTSSGAKFPAEPSRGVNPPEVESPLAPTHRIASLPESLTIQRITSSEPLCVVCRKTDNVQVCTKCSSSYHTSCISDGNCPRCYKCVSSPPSGTSSPTISEKMKQKLELLMKSNALCVEKSTLDQRKAQLVSAIQDQHAARTELLKREEEATVSIQRVHSFVQTFQKTPC